MSVSGPAAIRRCPDWLGARQACPLLPPESIPANHSTLVAFEVNEGLIRVTINHALLQQHYTNKTCKTCKTRQQSVLFCDQQLDFVLFVLFKQDKARLENRLDCRQLWFAGRWD